MSYAPSGCVSRRVYRSARCVLPLPVRRPSRRIAGWKRLFARLVHFILRLFLGFGGIRRSTLLGFRRLLLAFVRWAFHLYLIGQRRDQKVANGECGILGIAASMSRLVRFRFPLIFGLATSILICAAFAQKPFREYPGYEYENFPLPSDWRVPGEWTFARLMYPSQHRFYLANFRVPIIRTGGMAERIGPSTIPVRTAIFPRPCAG